MGLKDNVLSCPLPASGAEQTQTENTEAPEDTEEDNPEDPRSLSYPLFLSVKILNTLFTIMLTLLLLITICLRH